MNLEALDVELERVHSFAVLPFEKNINQMKGQNQKCSQKCPIITVSIYKYGPDDIKIQITWYLYKSFPVPIAIAEAGLVPMVPALAPGSTPESPLLEKSPPYSEANMVSRGRFSRVQGLTSHVLL